jgi:2-iminobutanoate/2-iminopropanoate deaminase
MSKMIITAKNAPAPVGPYSHAVSANGFVFVSGQIPLDANGNIVSGGVEAQTDQVFKNISAILTEAGLDFGDVVKTTVFLSDIGNFGVVNDIYARFFTDAPPARSAVEVAALPKGSLVEIEVVAATR